MGIWHAFMILFVLINNQILIILVTLIFVIGFNFGVGSILWVYIGEILDSRGSTVTGFTVMFLSFIAGSLTNMGKIS